VSPDVLDPDAAPVDELLRRLTPRVIGAVVRRFGDLDDAEDAVQEALVAAATRWPDDGVPDNPGGWLYRVAVRRLTDRIRSESARRDREDLDVARRPAEPPSSFEDDDSLVLLFMCCHPALRPAAAIALTLRAVGGLTTAEIAHAFLVPEATMAQRISRAKQRIREAGATFALPTADERDARLRSVLHILYLIFNEGYATTSGAHLARRELSEEAIRLTRAVHAGLPDDPEVAGLLALMLLTAAGRPARTGPGGELVPLTEQDRSHWDHDLITEGLAITSRALAKGAVGEYQLQALVAAAHDQAATAADTDWTHIAALYGLLERMTANPMVALNRAIAVAMADGPAAGLGLLAALDGPLAGHFRLDAVRGHLHEMAGDHVTAIRHYRAAAAATASGPEQRFLLAKASRLAAVGAGPDARDAPPGADVPDP
jgi:RNA polymerase sigma factor (sigma-70 family)